MFLDVFLIAVYIYGVTEITLRCAGIFASQGRLLESLSSSTNIKLVISSSFNKVKCSLTVINYAVCICFSSVPNTAYRLNVHALWRT